MKEAKLSANIPTGDFVKLVLTVYFLTQERIVKNI